ncbi:MAG: phosphoribosylglycinamide formyltransferase [Spirochaetaceae bacterium]|nr:phosphoribosylglycinamide formyltransferase [Spirochaetaceae bacterium]
MSRPGASVRILILVSGDGTNLQALIDAEKQGGLGPGKIAAVISDHPGAYALERARAAGIPALAEPVNSAQPKAERRRDLSDRILGAARDRDIGLIILAGFLSILEGGLITAYSGRIINLHPSLLPKFGGAGMYGERVHRAVLEAGETESGCTVHLVDAGTDTGPILLLRRVPVLAGDDPASLAERVHREEHIAIVEAAAGMAERIRDGYTQERHT